MTKYLVYNVSVMPYDVFCICSSESDAQEMVLALTEEELYETWYQYDQDCADFFYGGDFCKNVIKYQEHCARVGIHTYETLFYQAIHCETPDGWDYMKIEEV